MFVRSFFFCFLMILAGCHTATQKIVSNPDVAIVSDPRASLVDVRRIVVDDSNIRNTAIVDGALQAIATKDMPEEHRLLCAFLLAKSRIHAGMSMDELSKLLHDIRFLNPNRVDQITALAGWIPVQWTPSQSTFVLDFRPDLRDGTDFILFVALSDRIGTDQFLRAFDKTPKELATVTVIDKGWLHLTPSHKSTTSAAIGLSPEQLRFLEAVKGDKEPPVLPDDFYKTASYGNPYHADIKRK